jgi:glycosyltransferase involved in cell wall biosynthesis
MDAKISVLISTHNPNMERLERTVRAIAAQTLDPKHWECIVVDNASTKPVAVDQIPWNRAERRQIREERLGLTFGRLAGIRESKGELLVFVDDDNELAPDYLEVAKAVFDRMETLGVAGGIIEPEWCDAEPDAWVSEFFSILALRNSGDSILIGNSVSHPGGIPAFSPIGAGMIARRDALASWISSAERGGLTDRRGSELTSCGDEDIVFEAFRSGWSVGYFPQLKLTHIIPAQRLRVDYLARLNHGIAKSAVQLLHKHGIGSWTAIPPWTVPLRKARAYLRYHAWAGPTQYIRWRWACGQFEGRAALPR